MPEDLSAQISASMSSVESLKTEFLATANAMFGPGFVWLVKDADTGELKILNTYIAGSPHPAAHFRRQPVDMATQTTNVVGGKSVDNRRGPTIRRVGNSQGFAHPTKTLAPGGVDVYPVLCVNTWQHVWLPDWGINGKAAFLEAWWDRINWEEVASSYYARGPRNVLPHASTRAF